MGSPTGIVFGQRAPSLSFTPDDVLGDNSPALVVRGGLGRGRRTQVLATPPAQPPPTAANLYQEHTSSTHVPSFSDQRLELERARTLNTLIAQQHKDRTETRQLVAGAALAEELGQLDVNDPHYRVKVAKLFTQYPEGVNSPAAKAVAEMKHAEFTDFNKSQSEHRTAVYNATLQKRIEPLLSSDHVPFALKNQLMNEDGSFNANAVQQAEALHSSGGGKSGDEFYSKLQKEHGLTKSDLDSAVADPSAVKYMGPKGPVSAEAVRGKEEYYRASGTLPTGGVLDLPLDKFNALISTHKNLERQPPTSPVDVAAQEQVFRDRATMEATLASAGTTPVSAAPPGYAAWKAAGGTAPAAPPVIASPPAIAAPAAAPPAAPAPSLAPIDFLHRALGTAPAATPAPSPVAAASPSGLPDDVDAKLNTPAQA